MVRVFSFAHIGTGTLLSRMPARHEIVGTKHQSDLAAAGGPGGISRRKAGGSYYTPAPIVEHLLDTALNPVIEHAARDPAHTARNLLTLRVCDPSCGVGNFLIPAARRIAAALAHAKRCTIAHALREVASVCIYGVDLDPKAVAHCLKSLLAESGGDARTRRQLRSHIRCGNALLTIPVDSPLRSRVRANAALKVPGNKPPHAFHWPIEFADVLNTTSGGFDVIIGNPPYLNQLQSATASSRALAAVIARWSGDLAKGYADTAAAFLLLAARLTRPGGRVALVLPQSILASRDAGPIRRELSRIAALRALWVSGGHHFDASVHTCAPTFELRSGSSISSPIARSLGIDASPLPSSHISQAQLAAMPTWSPLAAAAWGVPEIPALAQGGTIADIATATADFRDQYYGLAGHIVEHASLSPKAQRDDRKHPKLITTAMIEPGRCLWGLVHTRLLKSKHLAPRADLRSLSPDMRRWAATRLVPKVLVATQTRVIEGVVDARGEWLPVTPIITVTPRDPAMIWLVAAAIMSPVAAAIAARDYGGAALSPGAIKLSARQLVRLPLPPCGASNARWQAAATTLQSLGHCSQTQATTLLHQFARESIAAFNLTTSDASSLHEWWTARLKAY